MELKIVRGLATYLALQECQSAMILEGPPCQKISHCIES